MGNNIFIGDGVIIYQHEGGGPVELGDRVMSVDEILVETLARVAACALARHTAIQPRCHFTTAVAPIRIGSGVQIAPQCAFYSYDHGIVADKLIRNQPLQSKGPIIIEDDAWLGFGVIVLSGVHIGKGAVTGAGAVVTHDIPEGVVAVGSPRPDCENAERIERSRTGGVSGGGPMILRLKTPVLNEPTKLVAIVVPLSKRPTLTPDEQISLRHVTHYFSRYDKYLVAPTTPERPGFPGEVFSDEILWEHCGARADDNGALVLQNLLRLQIHSDVSPRQPRALRPT